MLLSPASVEKIKATGLMVFNRAQYCRLLKPIGLAANCLPGYRGAPIITLLSEHPEESADIYSDAPVLAIVHDEQGWMVQHQHWVPGPGPGDFELRFADEAAAVQFVIDYYFTRNQYFEVWLAWQQSRQQ
jgi:hypothetical protein